MLDQLRLEQLLETDGLCKTVTFICVASLKCSGFPSLSWDEVLPPGGYTENNFYYATMETIMCREKLVKKTKNMLWF